MNPGSLIPGETKTEDIIVQLLRNLGSKKEVEGYLKLFVSVEEKRFAVIKVGGGVLENELEAVASSISFLDKVGLTPVVIHGAGPQLLKAQKEAGVVVENDAGERTAPPRAIEIARRIFQKENLKLVDALEALGTRARPIPTGAFEAELVDNGRLGFVGKISGVNLDAIESSIRAEQIPILASLGETPAGQIVNVNADEATRSLALALLPFKIVFLTPEDGIRDENGTILSAINLEEDFEPLMASSWLKPASRSKLQTIQAVLSQLPRSSSAAVASPEHLVRELFTVKGAGTLVRLGERIRCYESFESVDQLRLRGLLEDSFGRRLLPDYFEQKHLFRLYLADSYRATAILTHEASEGGAPYLDKFAVTTEAQGDGVGGSLWQRVSRENPKLFWRSRIDNEINPWYFARADGAHKTDKWVVFWYGVEGFDDIKDCIDRALAKPATLKAHHLGT